MKYVQNVRGKWIVRMTVPEELRAIIGQRELVEIGLPSDSTSREKKAVAIINAFHAKLDEAREVWESLGEASKPTLSSAAKEHYRLALELDDRARATILEPIYTEPLAFSRTVYANKLRLLVAGQLDSEEAEALIGYAANELKRNGPAPQVDRPTLLRTLGEIQLQALEAFEERDAGKIKLTPPSHPLLTEPDPIPKTMPVASAPKTGGMTLTDALKAFHAERTAGGSTLAAKTMEEHRNAARMFNEFMGGETAVQSITKKHVIAYKQALLETPNRYTMRFPGLTLPQAIKANKKLSEPIATLAESSTHNGLSSNGAGSHFVIEPDRTKRPCPYLGHRCTSPARSVLRSCTIDGRSIVCDRS